MNTETNSKYARKKKAGNMLYGPGCCGHKLPSKPTKEQQEKIDALRKETGEPRRRVYYA